MEDKKKKQLEDLAYKIRIDILRAGYGANGNNVHFGSTLSLAEIMSVLYTDIVRWDKNDIENRDRVVLSKGHGSLAHYSVLYEKGLIQEDEIFSFEHNGTKFAAHSMRMVEKGLEFASGSLSLGFGHAVGVALACKRKGLKNMVYAIIGDGELNEGMIWESLMFAAAKGLNNLVVIIDHNHMQACGSTTEILDTGELKPKFEAFGFSTQICDGHDVVSLENAFLNIEDDKPSAIIAETVKGKGVSFMENKAKWHYCPIDEKKYNKALAELGVEL